MSELVPGQLADVLEGRYKGETIAVLDVGMYGWVVGELPCPNENSDGDVIAVQAKHLRPWMFVKEVSFKDGKRSYVTLDGVRHGPS